MTRSTEAGGDRPATSAAVFDMDGLLIDSEPFWREAERKVFAGVGLHLSDRECQQTTGLRIDEVVGFWYARRPWPAPSPAVVASGILAEVIALVRRSGEPMPGVDHALSLCTAQGLRLALASSSSPELIEAVLDRLDLAGRFEVVHSAAFEKRGKPEPDVYLSTCARLQLPPAACVAFEDSLNGVRAARAAGMRCVAVAAGADPGIVSLADLVLPSLCALRPAHLS